MGERRAAEELAASWDCLTTDGFHRSLTEFLVANSGLPGPRGNLMLAAEFSRLIARDWAAKRGLLKGLIVSWSSSGDEYLMFVAHSAIGHVLSCNPEEMDWAVPILYEANFSPLWRAREGVTFALEALLEDRADLALSLIDKWCKPRDPIVVRNSIVALAHPTQLRRNHAQLDALKRYNDVGMEMVAKAIDPGDGVKILAKSLGFTISVAAEADEGYLDEFEIWIDRNVKVWRAILRENLTKARIAKKYPARIKVLLMRLG
jgi:hypothetical protein